MSATANALNQADRVLMPIASLSMMKELGWTPMMRGVALSAFSYGYVLIQIPSGWVASLVSPLSLLLCAVFAWSLSTILTAEAARYDFAALIVCRAVMGLSEGFCLPAVFQLLSQGVPASSRSRAFAVVFGCGSIGYFVALLTCPLIQPWDAMFHTFGGAGLVWCIVVAAVGFAHWHWGGRSCTAMTLSFKGDALSSQAAAREPPAALCMRLVKCKPLLAICAAHFAQNWSNFLLSSWLPTFLCEVLGMPARQLSLMCVPFLASATAGMLGGFAADRLILVQACSILTVRRLATAVGLLGPAFCHLLFTMTSSPTVAILIATASYTFAAMTSSGFMANHSEISEHAGLTFAISNTFATIPGVICGPLTVWLVRDGSWNWVFTIAAGINVAGATVYLLLSKAHRVL